MASFRVVVVMMRLSERNQHRGAEMEFSDRVAMVTGGAGALGTAVVLDLLARGARTIVTYRSDAEWDALQTRAAHHKGLLVGAPMDLLNEPGVIRCVEGAVGEWGRLDFFVAAAGGFAVGKSYESDMGLWDRILDINLRSLVIPLRHVVPVMIRNHFGRIVTVGSSAMLRGGGSGMAAYAVSKTAVLKLTEILAEEVKGHNIRVHSVLPGTMDTPANRQAMPKADPSQWVKTEQVARVIHFLLSDDSSGIQSTSVPVTGGN